MSQPSIHYLILGSLFFLVLGVAVTAVLPAVETASLAPTSAAYTPAQLQGRGIYIREGCVYCHTQQVRSVEANIGTVRSKGDIGPETLPADYVYQQPVLWGTNRQGPDLSHVASRPPGNSLEWQLQHLINPQLFNPGTLMPSFRHLPQQDLDMLVEYLMTLE